LRRPSGRRDALLPNNRHRRALPDGGRQANLNGIWQALNAASFDLEDHAAYAGTHGPGATGAVPAGYGIVEGGEIPYKPDALAKRKQISKIGWRSTPRSSAISRRTRAMYAVPVSNRPGFKSVLMAFEYQRRA
jgi:hypothetical protein